MESFFVGDQAGLDLVKRIVPQMREVGCRMLMIRILDDGRVAFVVVPDGEIIALDKVLEFVHES